MSDLPGAPETCKHCGGPLTRGAAWISPIKGHCERMQLPPHCPAEACRKARDEEAIADAIARGLIDP